MFEKKLFLNELFDLYGPLLSEKKQDVFLMYYGDDLSLSEISQQTGISRQGVRDLLERSAAELERFEGALGLAVKKKRLDTLSEAIRPGLSQQDTDELKNALSGLL
ncbi:MAG: DNA-binding protein [Clostridia bacterium]|nr:DNA-binding protein [Clostridia bacterium]